MTKKESAEKIIEQDGSCSGVFCCDCAIHKGCADITGYASHEDAHPEALSLAQAFLDSLEPPKQKPTTEEAEHPSELEIQKRVAAMVEYYESVGTGEQLSREDTLKAYKTSKEYLQLELLWDIRELLKKDLRKC